MLENLENPPNPEAKGCLKLFIILICLPVLSIVLTIGMTEMNRFVDIPPAEDLLKQQFAHAAPPTVTNLQILDYEPGYGLADASCALYFETTPEDTQKIIKHLNLSRISSKEFNLLFYYEQLQDRIGDSPNVYYLDDGWAVRELVCSKDHTRVCFQYYEL